MVARQGFAAVPGLIDEVAAAGLDVKADADAVVACELVLEALVARRRLSRTESGQYGRSVRRGKSGFPSERPEREE